MGIDLLYHAVYPRLEPTAREVLCALGERGMAADRWDGAASDAVAVLVVPSADAPSRAQVREAAARLRARRLVLFPAEAGEAELEDTVGLLRAGADDVRPWTADAGCADAVFLQLSRWLAVERELSTELVSQNLVGASQAWRMLLREVIEAAAFGASPLLLVGETGTGKELLARLVHALDRRLRKRDLVVVDCTTLSRELMGSELFGHERGAFTGALAPREGAVALADEGTLFLDEVGELPLELQSALLRVLQEKTYKRVGGDAWRRSEFRLVCATNRDLASEVARGAFRRDLYHRINGMTCKVPSLKQRPQDVIPLAEYFMAESLGTSSSPAISRPVRAHLIGRAYDGNVRELRQVVQGIARRYPGAGPVSVGCLSAEERERLLAEAGAGGSGNGDGPGTRGEWSKDWREAPARAFVRLALEGHAGLREIGRAVDEAAVQVAIEEAGSLRDAAARLGVTERALQMRRAAGRRASTAAGTDGADDENGTATDA